MARVIFIATVLVALCYTSQALPLPGGDLLGKLQQLQKLKDLLDKIKSPTTAAFAYDGEQYALLGIKDAIKDILGGGIKIVEEVLDTGKKIGDGVIGGVSEGIKGGIKGAQKGVQDGINRNKEDSGNAQPENPTGPGAVQAGLISDIYDEIDNTLKNIWGKGKDAVDSTLKEFEEKANDIKGKVEDKIKQL